jgi:type IV secretory pathway VirD2 relaxase
MSERRFFRFSFSFNAPRAIARDMLQIGDGRIFAGAGISTLHHADCISGLVRQRSTSNRRLMARNEDDFRIRLGKVRDRDGGQITERRIGPARGRPTSFVGEVYRAIRRAGGNPNRDPGTGKGGGRFNARGRGAATALSLKDRSAWSRDGSGVRTRARRVAVKARVVKLNPQRGAASGRQFVGAKAVDAHLRYLERDGVTKDGEKGQVYSAERDVEDGSAFLDRGREDRHQFRLIVSAEDGVELSDLRTTTRDLMQQMETDLGTKLAWIAVDHHNTGHPHTHILVRGVTEDGKILNIAGDYIAYGIRERASEVVTRELGRQTELEVAKQLEREVATDRFTRLDRMLIAEQQGREFSDLRPDQDMRDTFRQNRALLIERARKLERMGLATEIEAGKWMVSSKAEPTLRELGERGDIIKTMHRALEREGLAEDRHPGGYVLHRENAIGRITGRVLDKGLAGDQMGERVRLVIDGVDGRVHHIEMDAARAEDVGRGMIVVAGSAPSGPRAADRNIIDVAGEGGVYRPSEHLERARAAIDRIGGDAEAFVRSHVRRLEALRRAGHAERIDADHWRVPADLPARGQAYDLARDRANIRISVLSHNGLDQQIRSDGATWLDRELASPDRITLANTGFGREVTEAMERRRQSLVNMGHAIRLEDGRIRVSKDFVANLERMEVTRVGKAMAAERGLTFTAAKTGEYVSGTLVGSAQLASGRFAMIDDGIGFQLVPWQPVLDKRIGQHISGTVRAAGGIEWNFGRKRGLGI